MAELSPEGEDLVRAGRQADLPSDSDRERVRRALEARLGVAIGGAAAETAGDPRGGARLALRSTVAPWITIGLAGLAGAALFFALRGPSVARGPARSAAVPPVVPAARAPEPPARAPEPPAVEPLTPPQDAPEAQRASPAPPSINARPSGPARAQSTLSEEVALLSRAETELHAGRFESALRSLDEHERRFPRGALEQDRTAARAQALCALGRTAEAQAPLEQLARTAPNSPNEERARQACRNASR